MVFICETLFGGTILKRNQVQKLTATAICIAMGLLLPQVFHVFGAGTVFLPMHIPVLLCGFICGGPFGFLCGLLTPLLSSVFTGMPAIFPTGISMMLELATYGFLTGILYEKTEKTYVSLVGAMLGGRIVSGVSKAILLGFSGGSFGMQAFLTSAFITAWPGILIQLVIIPPLVLALKKAGFLIQERERPRAA